MYELFSKSGHHVTAPSSLAQALGFSSPNHTLMFIHPHDDDAIIGVGMVMAAAVAEGFDVQVVIATDGRGGYCRTEDQADIVQVRQREAVESFELLGVARQNLHFLGFGDGLTYNYIGRRPAAASDPAICGYTGLENSFTYMIRRLRPACIFTPANTDLHPDHQAVFKELQISIYHASGDIWPELGKPCALPRVYEYPVYAKLTSPPTLMLEGCEELFEKKLAAIAAYRSQLQIEGTVNQIRQAGAVEFLRDMNYQIYNPADYVALFKETVHAC